MRGTGFSATVPLTEVLDEVIPWVGAAFEKGST